MQEKKRKELELKIQKQLLSVSNPSQTKTDFLDSNGFKLHEIQDLGEEENIESFIDEMGGQEKRSSTPSFKTGTMNTERERATTAETNIRLTSLACNDETHTVEIESRDTQ